MLAIRLQRTGRRGHAMYRLIVQESHRTPTSGKVVALLGSHDPHAKTTILVKDKAEFYLKNGAHPSPRVARLLKAEGVKLPAWFVADTKKKGVIRNPEKLRKNRPAEEPAAATEPAEPAEEAVAEQPAVATTTETEPTVAEPEATEPPAESPAAETTDEAANSENE